MRVQTRPNQQRPRAGRLLKRAPHSGGPNSLDESTPAHAPSTELTVHVDRCGPRPVVAVTGALDTNGAALVSAMLDHVRHTEGRAADVDLSGVHHADSHGLSLLLDRQLRVRRASPIVERLLAALGRPLRRSARGGATSS